MAHAPETAERSRAQANIFVSYSRRDAAAAQQLLAAIEGKRIDAWVDWEDIPPSADWWREVCAAIESADAFVFLMSPDSLASRVCADELLHAVRHNKRLLPVVCREVAAVPPILEPLRRINWIFLRPGDAFDAGVSQLLQAVDTDLEWVRAHTRLVERAVEWEARGRDPSFLLHRNDLAEAERWLARGPDKEPRPTALQTEYIIAGRSAVTRQQRRLTAYAVAAGLLIAAGAIAALVGFRRAERNARDALSRQLSAESRLDLAVDTRSALARAVLAWRTAPTREAQSAVLTASHHVAGASRLLAGHDGLVSQTAFSPDGKLLATAADDSTVMLWDTATGVPVRRLAGHGGEISRIAFSPDGRRLVSASADHAVIIWDVATGKALHKLAAHEDVVVTLAISPDGTRLASVGEGGTVIVWEMASARRLFEFRDSTTNGYFVAFSPDRRTIATGGVNAAAAIWNADTGDRLHRLARHETGFLSGVSAAFLDGGQRLVTVASTDKDALVWDVQTGRQLTRLRSHESGIDIVAVSPDGRWIATGGEDKVNIWDAASSKRVRQLQGHVTTGSIYPVLTFSADNRHLLTRTAPDTAVLWDVENGAARRRFRGHGKWLLTGALSADGRWLATGGSDATSTLWDLTDPGPLRRIQNTARGIARGAFSPDGRWLAIESIDRATVLDVASGGRVRDLVHGVPVTSVAFSSDGRLLATGGADKAVLVWDTGNGALLRRLADHPDVYHVEFTAEGLAVTTAPFGMGRVVWDLQGRATRPSPDSGNPQPTAIARGARVHDIAYSADGARYATTTLDWTPIIWDRATGTELHRLQGHRGKVESVAFSPDGRWLGTGGRDDVAIVWDARSGNLLRRLAGHTDTINEVAFSPRGGHVATASDDGTAMLWDAATGMGLHRFEEHTQSVAYVAFSGDGKRLLTSSHDGTLVLLDLDPESLVDRACRILDPGLSEEAWARVVPGRSYPVSCRDLEHLKHSARAR